MADGPANEAGLFWAALRSAGIWADLQKLGVPGIQGVWSIRRPPAGGITVVSIRQMYAGHACGDGARRAMHRRRVFRQIRDRGRRRHRSDHVHQVLWAMATRSRPAIDRHPARDLEHLISIQASTRPEIRPWGSKALINACMDYRYYKSFSKRTKLSKDAYDRVVGRWQELGLAGEPPTITIFEDESSTGSVT